MGAPPDVEPGMEMTDFLPYLLNQAAEQVSLEFQRSYKDKYGMLRTDWRVLFHLGRYGDMIANDIVKRARIHKTKVSRAVTRLETLRFLVRDEVSTDRRQETLRLTAAGQRAYADLSYIAEDYNRQLWRNIDARDREKFMAFLSEMARLGPSKPQGS